MAIKTQGTVVAMETARAATVTITAITLASPGVITATNTYVAGDIIFLDSIAGMVQLNKRVVQATAPSGSAFSAKGVDTTLYSAYISGGTGAKCTMTPIGTITGVPSLFTGTAPDIKVTHLLSVAEEKLQGLPDFGDFTMDILLDNVDAGQAQLRAAKEQQVSKAFSITLTDGKIATFAAFVKSFSVAVAANEAVRATVTATLQAAPAWFA